MSDVFISYSRKNSDFVHKLDDALTAAKRDVWVDWADIGRGQDWWREIEIGVDSADTALIVITENWLVSEICQRELEYIRQQNKRVFPIVRQKIEGDVAIRVKGTWVDQEWEQRARDNWKYLRSVNWLYFDDDTTFDNAVKDLLTALDTDQVYVKSHTRYLVRAMEWKQSHLDPSFLLDGDQVDAAQKWLASSVGKTPEPHPVHHEYVTASSVAEAARTARDKAREALIRRFRQTAIGLGLGVVAAIIAAVVVGQQFIAARAEVTKAGATLQQVNLQVTDAINQQVTAAAKVQAAEFLVGTATIEQGQAIVAQQTSSAGERDASTRVAVAGATLSPVPPTLTAVAVAINDANAQQDIALYLSDASLAIANKDPDGALQTANDMVAGYPDQALAYLGRGLIYDTMSRDDEAIADYTKAIQLNPQYSVAYYNRGVVYGNENKLDEAVADYSKALELDPQNADAYLNRGDLYEKQGKFDAALADLNKALELNPQNANIYNERGLTYFEQGMWDKALVDYNKALDLNPQLAVAYNNRGLVLYNQEQYEAAAADYTQAVRLDPQYAVAFINRGDAYDSLGKTALAEADYTQSIAIDPQNAEAYNRRGFDYVKLGKMAEALADYWQWVQLNQTRATTVDKAVVGKMPFTTIVKMTRGLTYRIPFEAKAGQLVEAQAAAAENAGVDPLLIVLDGQGKPLLFNDDVDAKTINSRIVDGVLPGDGVYTLLVTYAGGGSEGEITVTLDLKAAPAAAPSPTPTPQ